MGQIQVSDKYFDNTFEYRHVVLPPEVAKILPKNRLLSEVRKEKSGDRISALQQMVAPFGKTDTASVLTA